MKVTGYDFAGWVTKNDLKCSDGRTIKKDAFKVQDGAKVPLVWQHQHDDPENVLGHTILENRDAGVYGYSFFNDTPKALVAKSLVQHKDINAYSIYANQLMQKGGDVLHGKILETSLVIAGANPGALIDSVTMSHSEGQEMGSEEDAVFYNDDYIDDIETKETNNEIKHEEKKMDNEKTVKDVFETLSEEQKTAVYAIIGALMEEDEGSEEAAQSGEGGEVMKSNVFDQNNKPKESGVTLSHDAFKAIMDDAKSLGSLKESIIAHADEYGITNIEALFPEARSVNGNIPEKIDRDQEWVNVVMNGVSKTPFSRIKSTTYDLTLPEARAKGYVKGNMKKEQYFSVARRVTIPTTIYKKQKLDRDDILDITDFDVVALIRGEMGGKWKEEAARAILVGDNREVDDDDKIDPTKVRPILTDASFYTIKKKLGIASSNFMGMNTSLSWTDTNNLATLDNINESTSPSEDDPDTSVTTGTHTGTITGTVVGSASLSMGDAVVEDIAMTMLEYKGTGTPILFTTKAIHTKLSWIRDALGRRMYASEAELCSALGVSRIVDVEILDEYPTVFGIIVSLKDYTVGTDRGGNLTTFEDFDIDFNQYKYLVEGRLSGALTRPRSAVALYFSDGEIVTEGINPTGVFGEYTGTEPYSATGKGKDTKTYKWISEDNE